jgi:hypothetical protein
MHDTLTYNNISYGNAGHGYIAGSEDTSAGSFYNNTFKNNLALGNTGQELYAVNGGQNDGTNGYGNVYTYNGFGPQGTNFINWGTYGTYYSTYSTWESAAGNCGSPGCSNSMQSDPTFANAGAAQFWLLPGSPAIAAGTTLSSPYNVGLSSSSVWPGGVVLAPANTPPDLGAYVF